MPLRFTLFAVVGPLFAWSVAATSVSGDSKLPPQPPLELTAVADTFGWRTTLPVTPLPPAIHGAEPSLVTAIDDTRGIAAAFVRFDLSQVRAPQEIVSARLELLATQSTPQRPPHISRVHLVVEQWHEATVADERVPRFSSAMAETTPVQGEWAQWDVTSAVTDWLGGAPNDGLAITSTSDLVYTQIFASRESGNAPRLILVFGGDIVPTPSPAPMVPDLIGDAVPICSVSDIAAVDFHHEPVRVTVRNVGAADAGPFMVRSETGTASWRVDRLAAGVTLRLAPQVGAGDYVVIDADNEVVESNEANNRLPVPFVTCLAPRALWFPLLFDLGS